MKTDRIKLRSAKTSEEIKVNFGLKI